MVAEAPFGWMIHACDRHLRGGAPITRFGGDGDDAIRERDNRRAFDGHDLRITRGEHDVVREFSSDLLVVGGLDQHSLSRERASEREFRGQQDQ